MSAPEKTVPATRLAATVPLLRDGAEGMEVFMVVRHQQIDFASGALVFPGGKLAPGDSDPRVLWRCTGVEGLTEEQVALRVGAIREAFEECGVLLARARGDAALLGPARLAGLGTRYRAALDHGEIGIGDLLEAEDLVLACEELVFFAHWITPDFMPKRFDTYFYLAVAPPDQVALHDGREMVDSVWLRPADALSQADAGSRTLVPATRLNVEKLGLRTTVETALAAARAEPVVTVLPSVVRRDDGLWLQIPPEAGYGVTEFAAPTASR
ncbi:MAG: NUDIX hydrolase [Panacagrimonas sp.]